MTLNVRELVGAGPVYRCFCGGGGGHLGYAPRFQEGVKDARGPVPEVMAQNQAKPCSSPLPALLKLKKPVGPGHLPLTQSTGTEGLGCSPALPLAE